MAYSYDKLLSFRFERSFRCEIRWELGKKGIVLEQNDEQCTTEKHTCLTCIISNGSFQERTVLFWLASLPEARRLLFYAQDAIKATIEASPDCLTSIVPDGIFQGQSVLFWLVYSVEGRILFFKIKETFKEAVNKVPDCLSFIIQAGSFKDHSILFWMVCSVEGQLLLFEMKEEVKKALIAYHDCLTCIISTGKFQGKSVLFFLSQNGKLLNQFADSLELIKKSPHIQNVLLTPDKTKETILSNLLKNFEDRAKLVSLVKKWLPEEFIIKRLESIKEEFGKDNFDNALTYLLLCGFLSIAVGKIFFQPWKKQLIEKLTSQFSLLANIFVRFRWDTNLSFHDIQISLLPSLTGRQGQKMGSFMHLMRKELSQNFESKWSHFCNTTSSQHTVIESEIIQFFNFQPGIVSALRILEINFLQWRNENFPSSMMHDDVKRTNFFKDWIVHNKFSNFALPIPDTAIFPSFKATHKQHSILSRFLTWMLTEAPEYAGINLGREAKIARFIDFIPKEAADRWVKKGNLFVDFSIPHGKYSHLLQFTLIMISLKECEFKSFSSLHELLEKLIDEKSHDGDSLWIDALDSYHEIYKKGPGIINAMFLSNWVLQFCPTFGASYRIHYVKKLITYLENEKIPMTQDKVEEVLRYFIGLGTTFYVETDHANIQKNIREKLSLHNSSGIYLLKP